MSVESTLDWSEIHTRLRPLLRFGSAGLLLPPGASKFVTYDQSVRFFSSLGIPSPELLVPVVGLLELVVAILFITDRATRIGAVITGAIMVVAAFTAGPTWQNIGVLGAAVVLAAFETPEVQTDT